MGILENLLMKDKINGTEKAIIFRELIKTKVLQGLINRD